MNSVQPDAGHAVASWYQPTLAADILTHDQNMDERISQTNRVLAAGAVPYLDPYRSCLMRLMRILVGLGERG